MMKRKCLILTAVVLGLAVIFCVGVRLLNGKNNLTVPKEETISIEEVEYFLSEASENYKEEFVDRCNRIIEEKGYLPKDKTVKDLVTFMQEKQPELDLGEKELSVVSISDNTIYVQNVGTDTNGISLLQIDRNEMTDEEIKAGNSIFVFASNKTIYYIYSVSSSEVHLNAAWIKDNTNGLLKIKYFDFEYEWKNQDASYQGYEDIADVVVKDGVVTQVKPYTDKVNAKLISIKNGEIELEDNRIYPYTEDIQVYKLFGNYEPYTLSDLKIGYDFTDFVLNEEGKIVAALVTGEAYLEKIRVVLKTTGFESAYHNEATLICDTDMEWKSGDKSGIITAGTEILVNAENEMFVADRIYLSPIAKSAKIGIPSIERNQGVPYYRGKIELERTSDGILIINELMLDEYLYSVVPSEMPASYPIEALKAQAVSARTYAYAHMLSSRLQSYGAHVDDSAAFQVYNNIAESESTTGAVRETEGIIVFQNNLPVTTYFYSTSCGYGTDLCAWMSENDPYLKSKKIGQGEDLDLSNEEVFASFIYETDVSCYEAEESYFRWRYETEIDEALFLEVLQKRFVANPHQILTLKGEEYTSEEITDFGVLKEIKVLSRAKGGAITELLLVGSERSVKILSEKNVRYVLANASKKVMLGADYAKEGNANGMLPSAFLTIEPHYDETDNETVTGYTIYGGGFGHGIGMSQNGARQMAKRDFGFDEILQFFYVDTELKNMKQEAK